MSRRPTWIQVLPIQNKLTPEQTDQLEDTIRQAAAVMQTTFEAVAHAVRNIVIQVQESPDWQALARQMGKTDTTLEEFKRRYDLPAHKYERPRLPSQQGYRRTPYDCWRASLGKRRGKRKL